MSETGANTEGAQHLGSGGNKLLIFQSILYFVIGASSPVTGILSTEVPMTNRVIALMILLGLGGGCAAVKAFLSTTFADSNANAASQPTKKVEIDQPADKRVPVDATV